MTGLIAIYSAGVLTLFMAFFHSRFYQKFNWKEEYAKISPVNRKIFYTIHIFLTINFIIIGFISLLYAHELSKNTGITFAFNLLISLFWFIRAIWQIFYFKGKALHVILIFYFIILCILYSIPTAVGIF